MELCNDFAKKMFERDKWSFLNRIRRDLEKETRALVSYSGSVTDPEFSAIVDRLRGILGLIDEFHNMIRSNSE